MYQPKVKNIQKYSDSQGDHLVHLGNLKLIPNQRDGKIAVGNTTGNKRLVTDTNKESLHTAGQWRFFDPIIISKTEEIKEGDKYFWEGVNVIRIAHSDGSRDFSVSHKILALREHFSDKHLQAIVDGKMKDGDEVLVKSFTEAKYKDEEMGGKYEDWTPVSDFLATGLQGTKRINTIHLDQQNHITLFPIKQSLEEAYFSWFDNVKEKGNPFYKEAFKAGAEWAVKTNYKG